MPGPTKAALQNAMLFYKKHSINRQFREEKSFALMLNFFALLQRLLCNFPAVFGN